MLNRGAKRLRAELLSFIDSELNGAFDQERNPYWTSATGYNLKGWEAEAYGACRSLVQEIKPHFVETPWGYTDRVLARLEALKTSYRESSADEDGGGVGAVGSIISEFERRLWARISSRQ